ncbi:MAG: hypothetical protein JXR76_11725 [Deltaproteobacteria bacterium]|nr:hypothetical protein [Deltaproteobacteria bacterium]
MARLIIKLSPEKLSNPDADLRYDIPNILAERTGGSLEDDGYDYLDDNSMVIHMVSHHPDTDVPRAIEILQTETIHGNHILDAALIVLIDNKIQKVVFPKDFTGDIILD